MSDAKFHRMVDVGVAAARLGVRPQTLYSYVSRGLIHSQQASGDARARLYSLDDIERLVWRKTHARKPTGAAASALSWGLPVLETALSAIEEGELRYRGVAIGELAAEASLEKVAALLWNAAEWEPAFAHFDPSGLAGWQTAEGLVPPVQGFDRAVLMMALLRSQPALAPIGAELKGWLIRALASSFAGRALAADLPLHQALALAWQRPEASELIRCILVCCADHELNSSTFTVRVAASSGVDLATCLLTGLSSIAGHEHVGLLATTRAMLADALATQDLEKTQARWARPRSPLPGFYHRLYPDGDPRARAILSLCDLPAPLAQLVHEVASRASLRPNIEFAMVAAEQIAGLPTGAAEALFVTGRAVGWLAHAEEQRLSGILIRPRAQSLVQRG